MNTGGGEDLGDGGEGPVGGEGGGDSCVRVAAHLALQALLGDDTGTEVGSPQNFAFSPLSLRAALGLVAVGCSGRTLEQVLSFLGLTHVDGMRDPRLAAADVIAAVPSNRRQLPIRIDRLPPSLVRSAREGGKTHTSFVAGVWLDQELTLNPDFKEVATTIHRAEAKSVDFLNKPSEVGRDINSWAEKETKGLLKDFLPANAVTDTTKLIVANALFFHGAWREPFDKSLTFDSEFHLLGGGSVRVPFMTTTKDRLMISSFDDGLKVLELAYKVEPGYPILFQRCFRMYVFLPADRDGLRRLTDQVASDPSFLRRHLPQEIAKAGVFMLPRFEASWGACDTVDTLRDLGLPLLFSAEAQLDRLATHGSRQYEFKLSSVFHMAAVKVDEEGTVAAAATACGDMGFSMEEPPLVDFVADHPFLFVIIEGYSEQVVFYGHVVNPVVGIE